MRKKVLCALLLTVSICGLAHAQTAPAPPHEFAVAPVQNGAQQIALGNGVVALMGPWKFRVGDDLAWAQPGYDDSTWQDYTLRKQGWPDSVVPSQDALDPGWSGHGHRSVSGYGWYRIHLRLDRASGPLCLLVQSIEDANTVYWDGQKIGGSGDPSRRLAYVNQRTQSLVVSPALSVPGEHVLAVRVWAEPFYALKNEASGGGLRGAPLLTQTQIARNIQSVQQLRVRLWSITNGTLRLLPFVLVGIVSLALFFYNRSRREYLWTALTLLIFNVEDILSMATLFSQKAWLTIGEYAIADSLSAGMFLFSLMAMRWLLGLQDRRGMRYVSIALGTTWWLAVYGLNVEAFGDWTPSPHLFRFFDLTEVASLSLCVACSVWIAVVGVRKLGRQAWIMLTPNFAIAILFLWVLTASYIASQGVGTVGGHILMVLIPISVLAILLYRFVRQWREHRRLETDFENARQVQQLLVPATAPNIPGFAIETVYLPAGEVGGDFFQILPSDDGSLLIVVGDVSGKGLKAAMTVSTIVGALRNEKERKPADVLRDLNRVLHGHGGGFVTCMAALIAADGAMTLANAGNLAPYRNGQELAPDPGLPLGIVGEGEYSETHYQLAPGDRLTFVSDGVVEATNEKRELFGFDRTQAISNQSAQLIADTAKGFGQEDDISVLSVTRAANMKAATA